MNAERPLVLVGLRCSGKSTLGRALATALGRPFLDLDDELAREARADWPAAAGPAPAGAGELYRALGETAFRERETALLERWLERPEPLVLATGAGVVESARARALLGERARVLWLRVGEGELARRMRADPTLRPALHGLDPVSEIPRVASRRTPWYRELADLTLDCGDDSPERLLERALRSLRQSP